MKKNDKKDRGSEIILHVSKDSKEFLEDARIRTLLSKYNKFMPIPIKFGTKEISNKVGEGKDEKEIKEIVDDIVNNPNPAWTKKPSNLKESRNKVGIDDRFTVLFVGRLIPVKGIKLLVEIAQELDQIQFVFIGGGPLEFFLKDVSDQNSNIKFLGQVQNIHLPYYYSSADIFCIPSQYKEGLGRVVMESVACGTPVVGSNLGGISEALSETVSILVKPTHNNLKNAIKMLYIDNEKLETLKNNCRDYAIMNYSEKNLDLVTRHYD